MSSIVEFLRARLDEDEALARECILPAHQEPNAYKPHPELSEWFYDGDEVEYVQTPEMLAHKYPDRLYVTMDSEGLSPSVEPHIGAHIARHDPARVLREVEAKRELLEASAESMDSGGAEGAWSALILATVAAVYADHPDYDPEWA